MGECKRKTLWERLELVRHFHDSGLTKDEWVGQHGERFATHSSRRLYEHEKFRGGSRTSLMKPHWRSKR